MQNEEKKNDSKSGSSKWYLGSAAALLLLKGKSLLALLKFSKFGGALISMAITIGTYAIIYPWGFAVGFVLLLFVHELGHVLAAKRKGLPVSAPLFIPFLGALITMKRQPLDAQTEAYVAMGGPLLGTVGAMAVYAGAYATDSPLLYALVCRLFPEPDQPAADSSARRRTDFHGSDALAVAGGPIGWNCSRSIFKILFIFLDMGVLCLRFVQKIC